MTDQNKSQESERKVGFKTFWNEYRKTQYVNSSDLDWDMVTDIAEEVWNQSAAQLQSELAAQKQVNKEAQSEIERLKAVIASAANEIGNMPHHDECEKWCGYPHKCDCGIDDIRKSLKASTSNEPRSPNP